MLESLFEKEHLFCIFMQLFTWYQKDTANEAQLEPSQTYMIGFFCENS